MTKLKRLPITFSRTQKEGECFRVAVNVGDTTVGELIKYPTDSAAQWHSYESEVRLPDGRFAGLPDDAWGSHLGQAKTYVRAYVRGMMKG